MTQDSLIYLIGSGIVSSLAGVVVYLQVRNEKSQEKYQNETRKDLEECRQDREKLWKDRELLWVRVGELQAEIGKLLRG
jgi:hypothetical protein